MNFAFSFSGSIQEEGHQDPPKMEVLKGHNGLSKANNVSPAEVEIRENKKRKSCFGSSSSSFC